MRGPAVVLGAMILLAAGSAAHAKTRPPRATHATPAFTVPFLEDDFARALTSARAKKVPIFVEAWAPW
jgi:hypothetical protein